MLWKRLKGGSFAIFPVRNTDIKNYRGELKYILTGVAFPQHLSISAINKTKCSIHAQYKTINFFKSSRCWLCVCVKEKCLQYVILKKHDLAFLSKHLGIRDIFIGLGLNFHPQWHVKSTCICGIVFHGINKLYFNNRIWKIKIFSKFISKI